MDSSENLREISAAQWADVLESKVHSAEPGDGSLAGRVFIHIDSEHQYRILNSPQEAASMGLTQKNLRAIISVTMSILQRSKDPSASRRLMESMDTLARLIATIPEESSPGQQKTHQIAAQVHSSRESDDIARLNERMQGGAKTFTRMPADQPQGSAPAPAQSTPGYAAPEREGLLEEALETENHSITRSLDGRDGVFFVRSGPTERQVVKFCHEPSAHIVADRMMKQFFVTPNYQEISPSSPMISRARDAIRTEGKTSFKKTVETLEKTPNRGGDAVLLRSRLEQMDWLVSQRMLVADYCSATAFKDLSQCDTLDILEDKHFVRQLGQMFVLDVLIHNTDRLSDTECNLGNLMVNGNEQDGFSLLSIDHDYRLNADTLHDSLDSLTKLMTGDGVEQRVDLMLNSKNLKLTAEQRQQLIKGLKEAVKETAQTLLDMFDANEGGLDWLTVDYGDTVMQADVECMKQMLSHLKTLI